LTAAAASWSTSGIESAAESSSSIEQYLQQFLVRLPALLRDGANFRACH